MNTLLLFIALCGQLYGESPEERAARIIARSNEEIARQQQSDADSARIRADMNDYLFPPAPQRIIVQSQPQRPVQGYSKIKPLGIGQPEWAFIIIVGLIAGGVYYWRCKASTTGRARPINSSSEGA